MTYNYLENRLKFQNKEFESFESGNIYTLVLDNDDLQNKSFNNIKIDSIIDPDFLTLKLKKSKVYSHYYNGSEYIFCLLNYKDYHTYEISDTSNAIFDDIDSKRSVLVEKVKKIMNKVGKFFISKEEVNIVLPNKINQELAYKIMLAINNGFYQFRKYKNKNTRVLKLNVLRVDESVSLDVEKLQNIADGRCLMRNLCDEAPNVIYPENYANIIRGVFKELECDVFKIKVLNYDEMLELNMGGICGVGQGSYRKPCAVIFEYKGNPSSNHYEKAILGKGVTFDTGGISLKTPSQYMIDMKYDMTGSAVVASAMYSAVKNKEPVNVIGMIGLAENMPGGGALKPSDVIQMMSGHTVEVLNTDAEGRLVLADLIHYVQEKYNVREIVDIATLTGAIQYAVGDRYVGLFANNTKMYHKMVNIGSASGQKAWPFPVNGYEPHMETDMADIKNISHKYKGAGSITAGVFLKFFVKENVSFAHLDIAAVCSDFDYKYILDYITHSEPVKNESV